MDFTLLLVTTQFILYYSLGLLLSFSRDLPKKWAFFSKEFSSVLFLWNLDQWLKYKSGNPTYLLVPWVYFLSIIIRVTEIVGGSYVCLYMYVCECGSTRHNLYYRFFTLL